jgi:hypothetical protein
MQRKVDMKQSSKKVMRLLSFLFVLFIWNPSTAKGGILKSEAVHEYAIQRETNVMEILWVLEKKTGDQKLLEKAKEKLFTLRDSQLFLITSLSDQIAREGDKPGGDIAFLLIVALIILS